MVLTNDEVLVLMGYYENLINHIDRRIDAIKSSKVTLLLDPDIIEKQIDSLMDNRKLYENRIEKLENAANL